MNPRQPVSTRLMVTALVMCVAIILVIVLVLMTDDAESKPKAGPVPALVLAPPTIQAGDRTVIHGRGFDGKASFTLFATLDSRRVRVGWATTDPWGRLTAPLTIRAGTLPGVFTITACRRGSCKAQSASARLRVTR